MFDIFLLMEQAQNFDLLAYLSGTFIGFSLGGNVLGQWTPGLRFNIGIEHVDRAIQIYEQAFGNAAALILINEDWNWEPEATGRWYSLFTLPELSRSSMPFRLTKFQPEQRDDDDQFTITWAALPPSDLASGLLFQAIANQDHGRTPSVRGSVYIVDPSAGLLMHMYDDRGLDLIATDRHSLEPLHERFNGWINKARMDAAVGIQRWWRNDDSTQIFR